MAFPRNFLTDIAREKELSLKEKEVFLALLGDDKSRPQIAQMLHVGESAVSSCLTGIYRKFQIPNNGPVKESRLKDYLTDKYRHWKPENSEDSSIIDSAELSIDVLVREVRQQIQPYIQEKCGTMRVLDMRQPIGLGEIYTNVNILEQLTGLEADEKFSKLMILGKPGAGKTTFLKHLAIQCIREEFQAERVPVFVTLKDFAKTDKNSDLWEYLAQSILINPLKAPNFESLQNVVRAGRALILLDGLDEVRDADSDWVLRQIQDLLKFSQNQFIITCRITSREYTFEQFTKVEIADFDDKQMALS